MTLYFRYTILFTLLLSSCFKQSNSNDRTQLKGIDLLSKSQSIHDPNGLWNQLELSVYIQEPRIGNPSRYSKVHLNNANGAFELIRNREQHLSKHVIDENGQAKVYLDDSEEIVDSLVEKFRLKPERNLGYRDFYHLMYGLPMSLNDESVSKIGEVGVKYFNDRECYLIPIELKEAMFSKNWVIYIAKDSYKLKGLEIVFPEDTTKGERLYFEGNIDLNGVHIPRIRHWHEYASDEYSGSDIVLKKWEK